MSLVSEFHGVLAPDRQTTATSAALVAVTSMTDALAVGASGHEIGSILRTGLEG